MTVKYIQICFQQIDDQWIEPSTYIFLRGICWYYSIDTSKIHNFNHNIMISIAFLILWPCTEITRPSTRIPEMLGHFFI